MLLNCPGSFDSRYLRDGTARVQTVSAEGNLPFRRSLEAFDRLTGMPIILNTSFNVAGKPIVETPAQALECFLSTEIDALVLGSFLLQKTV